MSEWNWEKIGSAPEGEVVETCISDIGGERNKQTLVRFGRLWFVDKEKSMYVYYTPTHWRPVQSAGSRDGD